MVYFDKSQENYYKITIFLGDLINIPVIMIKKMDGENIKEFLLSNDENVSKTVSVSISFELVSYFFFSLNLIPFQSKN